MAMIGQSKMLFRYFSSDEKKSEIRKGMQMAAKEIYKKYSFGKLMALCVIGT